ncbi:Arginyl-tRNA synthetase [Labilithrix luteola]|uniref:Arginine--tRNA ligase n=1 Tax=Labilithrix luteola TaxID=1391654 RepID=A0A0K1Q4J7_9BACT|nr:arginine--tRNA ligase [Labilithrix luteola]AKV00731.1 Arginyl-tRNA synthetase [Labilithrix luteola]
MADPIVTLAPRFEAALRQAFGEEHAKADPALRRGAHADLQADVALGLAKKLQKKPREVADAIVAVLDVKGIVDKVEVAGPGFINLSLSNEWLSAQLAEAAADPRLSVPTTSSPETVVVDYSGPNVAKEMHVGHIRSTVIGDTLVRTLEFLGHTVIRQNHLGDWGTPFGMLIEHLIDLGQDKSETVTVKDLDAFYKEARTKFDADPAFADRARKRVVSLQAGDADTLVLWKRLVDESKRYFGEVYEKLGVTLTEKDFCAESHYNPLLAGVVTELEGKGLVTESDGALCAFPAGFKTKEGEPLPLIVRKQDGGYGYATTDLTAIRERIQTRKATRILYVVGTPQQQHLQMVFAVARDAGWLVPPARAEHVNFGSILGPDKKMFKTRAGGTVKLIDLLDEATSRASAIIKEKDSDLDDATRDVVARQVGIGAIKYADLSSDRVKDYVFDWSRMLAFDGNTAPYVQYAHARSQNIFRKEGIDSAMKGAAIVVREPAEHALAMELLNFGATARSVADTLQPHRMCTYLYGVASAFTTFYEKCPVLKAEDEATKTSRLALASLAGRVLARGLDLLGIEAPQRM